MHGEGAAAFLRMGKGQYARVTWNQHSRAVFRVDNALLLFNNQNLQNSFLSTVIIADLAFETN